MEAFEGIQIYEVERKHGIENFSPVCILVDGVYDINFFSNQIRTFLNSSPSITEINNGLVLLSFNSSKNLFIDSIEKELEILHYQAYSIFIKKSLICNIINEFENINKNLFYLCYECNSQIILDKIKIQNAKYFKHISTSSHKSLYGFSHYSDLISSYLELVKGQLIWPIFTFLPIQMISLQKNKTSSNRQLLNFSRSCYPTFRPLEILHYFYFIEKVPRKPQRKLNVDELFEIKNIPDVQISHLLKNYQNNFSKEFVIGTFLGFENQFRCIHLFDYFVRMKKKKNDSIIDVFLINKIEYPLNSIKYDMFYIEVRTFIECSLMYSINNVDSFNLKNCCSNEISTFYGFDNKNDFINAKKLIKSYININDYVFKDLKIINYNELLILFPKQKAAINSKKKLFFLIFRLKFLNEKNKVNSPPLLKDSVLFIKDEKCSINSKLYTIAGFVDDKKRYEAFSLLKKSKYLNQIKSYKPEIESKQRVKHFIINKNSSLNSDVANESIENQEDSNDQSLNSIEDEFQDENNDMQSQNKNDNFDMKTTNKESTNSTVENDFLDENKGKKSQNKNDSLNQKTQNKTKTKSSVENDFDFLSELNNQPKEQENKSLSDEEQIQNYVDSMKIVYTYLINFVEKAEYDENDNKKLIQIVKEQKIKENPEKLQETFLIILQISKNHFKTSFFYERIEKIILVFRDVLKKNFTNIGIFNIFAKSKYVLLILIKQKLLIVDQQIASIITSNAYMNQNYHIYFYPEIKQFIDESLKKEIEESINKSDFKQKRQNGLNTDPLCDIIRLDLIETCVTVIESQASMLNLPVNSSEFEKCIYLSDHRTTYIEYAALYGSIKIINYYLNRIRSIDVTLWFHAIYGNKFDIIHLLEQRTSNHPEMLYLNCYKQSVKCHHNEMAKYFLSKINIGINDFPFEIKYHNYAFISKNTDFASLLVDLCKHCYTVIVNILLNSSNKAIKEKIIFIIKIKKCFHEFI